MSRSSTPLGGSYISAKAPHGRRRRSPAFFHADHPIPRRKFSVFRATNVIHNSESCDNIVRGPCQAIALSSFRLLHIHLSSGHGRCLARRIPFIIFAMLLLFLCEVSIRTTADSSRYAAACASHRNHPVFDCSSREIFRHAKG